MQKYGANLFGKDSEEQISRYLMRDGFLILEKNYRKVYGEIDIIATKGELIIFVEVKARRDCKFDFSSVVNKKKQAKIVRVAREYIARHTKSDKVYRFDVALVEGSGPEFRITYIPHAFVADTE